MFSLGSLGKQSLNNLTMVMMGARSKVKTMPALNLVISRGVAMHKAMALIIIALKFNFVFSLSAYVINLRAINGKIRKSNIPFDSGVLCFVELLSKKL